MATISESGYARLVANFKLLIAAILQFAARFNPSKPSLKPEALQELAVKCDTAMLNVSSAKAAYKNSLDEREKLFSQLSKLCTRILNALKASDTTERIVADAQSIVRKIQGSRSKRKAGTENPDMTPEEATKVISASQMSYDNRINNFQDLLQFLAGIPSYKPNEPELQVESLNKHKEDLIAKNKSVVTSYLALQKARAERNDLLFKPGTGLVDTAADAKAYMKSLFGATSPEFKQVSKIRIQ